MTLPTRLACACLAMGWLACGDSSSEPDLPGLNEACDPQHGCASGLGCIDQTCQELTIPGFVLWMQSQRPPDALHIIATHPDDPLYLPDGRFDPSSARAEQVVPAPVTYPAVFRLTVPPGPYILTGYVPVNGRAAIGHLAATLQSSGVVMVAGEPVDDALVNLTIEEELASSP